MWQSSCSPSATFCLPLSPKLFKFHWGKKTLPLFIAILSSLPICFWEQHSAGSADLHHTFESYPGVTLAMVGLLSHCFAASLWSQAVLLHSMAAACRRLQVRRGSLGSASLRLNGQTRSNPVPLSCRARGYRAEMLFSLTVRTHGKDDVMGCCGFFYVLIAEVVLFPSFLCGSPSYLESWD